MKRTLTLWLTGAVLVGVYALVHWNRWVAVSVALAVLAGVIWGPWWLSPDRAHLRRRAIEDQLAAEAEAEAEEADAQTRMPEAYEAVFEEELHARGVRDTPDAALRVASQATRSTLERLYTTHPGGPR